MPSDSSGSSDDDASPVATDRDSALSRRRLLAATTATAIGGGVFPGQVGAESIDVPADTTAAQSQSDEDVIRERAWVETDVDTNDAGEPDRIYVEIVRRPATESDERPVILRASPYFGEYTHSSTTPEMLFDRAVPLDAAGADERAGAAVTAGTGTHGSGSAGQEDDEWIGPLGDEERFLSRGYVVAYAASLGIGRSTGCYTAAGPPTAEAMRAVVDWFNGRATAFDARSGGESVVASWTDGSTGMIGTSANGELANAVATTGVDGLDAIVPIAANNGQYSLFRANGTPIAVTGDPADRMPGLSSWIAASTAARPDCQHWVERAEARQDRASGDYNDFWHDREFLPDADAVDCGVLLCQGLDDDVVKPNNAVDWYAALDAADVPVRLWLHGGGHAPPADAEWDELVDRWFDHWLQGADDGVLEEDPVTVAQGSAQAAGWSHDRYADWPIPDSERTILQFESGGRSDGGLTLEGGSSAEERFTDDSTTSVAELAGASESTHRLRYRTPPLGESVHVSGTVVLSLAVEMDALAPVSAALVEYGPEGGVELVTRGWTDPRNRASYREHDDPVSYKQSLRESSPIEADEQVTVEFPLQAIDHVFDADSRIGIVVYASDREFTLHPPNDAEVTVALGEISASIPVVGGEDALTDAFAEPAGDEDTDDGDDAESADGGDADDDGLPGFGIGSALAALGGTGYALRRRIGDGDERPSE